MFALPFSARVHASTRQAVGSPRNTIKARSAISRAMGRSGRARRQPMLVVLAVATAGCSVHPLPDDVSGGAIPTQEIVRSARCEMRLGLFDQVRRVLKDNKIEYNHKDLLTIDGRKRIRDVLKATKVGKKLLEDFEKYGQVAVAYDFDFGITEHNSVDGGLAFKLPLVNGVFDLGGSGVVHKTRVGQRSFKAQETFNDLVERDTWCNGFKSRDENLLYPVTGSIGLQKVVETFIAISEQGGGKDSFVDTLIFTTTISGRLGAAIKLNPVSQSFRLVSADAAVGADRTDVHKIVISLAFPVKKKDRVEVCIKGQVCLADEYKLNPIWRARYNICVADARSREDAFKVLRHAPPEVYCIELADNFVPRSADGRLLQATARSWMGMR